MTKNIESIVLKTEPVGENIPNELKTYGNWVCWKAEKVTTKQADGTENIRISKIPINPRNGSLAKSNDKNTWSNFNVAMNRLKANNYSVLSGLGFMFVDGIVGVDIDHCIVDGEISEVAADIISSINSYTEISPSGTGIHIYCKGRLQEGRRKIPKLGLEIYDTGRYFTVTGNSYGELKDLESRTHEIAEVFNKYFVVEDEGKGLCPQREEVGGIKKCEATISLSADEIIKRAFESNDTSFQKLYYGDLSSSNGDWSSADLSFCNRLAFWTGKDANMMDEIFRSSGLYRDKWDKKRGTQTYGAITITKAISGCMNVYELQNHEYPEGV